MCLVWWWYWLSLEVTHGEWGRSQVSSVSMSTGLVYVGTCWGCMVAAEAGSLAIFGRHNADLVSFSLTQARHCMVSLGRGYRNLIERFSSRLFPCWKEDWHIISDHLFTDLLSSVWSIEYIQCGLLLPTGFIFCTLEAPVCLHKANYSAIYNFWFVQLKVFSSILWFCQ